MTQDDWVYAVRR